MTGWLFFEQNLLEPNIGTGRFWLLTGRAEGHDELLERWRSMGRSALEVLERQLTETEFLLGERYGVADVCLYAYTHVAPEAGSPRPGRPRLAGSRRSNAALHERPAALPRSRGPGGARPHG